MTLEDGTDRLYQHIGKELPLYATLISQKSANLTYVAEETRIHALSYTILSHKTFYLSPLITSFEIRHKPTFNKLLTKASPLFFLQ